MWKLLVLMLIGTTYVSCNPCSDFESLNITTGVLKDDGSMDYNGIVFQSDEWYKVYDEGGAMSIMGCPCLKRVCLWKCCAEGSMMMNKSCSETDAAEVNPFSPPLFKGTEPSSVVAKDHFFYMQLRFIPCDERYRVDTLQDFQDIYIQENATLMEVVNGRTQWHPPNLFCVDMMATTPNLPTRLIALVCYPPVEPNEDDSLTLYIAYAVGLLISLPFLLATFLVYAFVSELRNLHGMCLMAYCAGLIVAYPMLAYLKINIGQTDVVRISCLVSAFIIYFAFQTSFFWLNIMCFDIWRTFSGYRGGGTNKSRDVRRFLFYGIYAWGVPMLLTAGTMAVQFSSYGALPAGFIRPNFGDRRCWFEDWHSEMVYFFTPVLVLVACNIVLFSVTAFRIRSIRQETAILKSSESSRSDKLKRDKQRYALYLKLFMVMGVNWSVEIIGFAVGGSNWYWVLADLANISLGVFIFFIFVWKSKVRTLVRKKFNKWRGGPSGAPGESTSKWATRSSSAPTEVTRVSTDDAAIRMKDLH